MVYAKYSTFLAKIKDYSNFLVKHLAKKVKNRSTFGHFNSISPKKSRRLDRWSADNNRPINRPINRNRSYTRNETWFSWNARHCFRAWIFRECEFTDPSLVCRTFGPMEKKERMKMHVVVVLKVKWSTIAFLKAFSQEKEKSLIYFIGLP